jgi:hypothetical protein
MSSVVWLITFITRLQFAGRHVGSSYLLSSSESTRLWACSFRMLARCPPRLMHSISASCQGRRRSSTAVTQNWRIDTHPKPHVWTTATMGSALYHSFIVGMCSVSWELWSITTLNTILFPREVTLTSRRGSPFFVQCVQVDTPSQSRVNRPEHGGSGSL